MVNKQDLAIVRGLAARVAEIAALPVQEEKRSLWRKLNGLRPERPMVLIDQICWNEMNVNDEMTLQCTDEECRGYEWQLRATLYRWKRFPVDMVVEPYIPVAKAIHNTGWGVQVKEHVAVSDPSNPVVGHLYLNQMESDEDLAKLQVPRVTHDAAETARRMAVGHELFDGLLEVRSWGMESAEIWDPIAGIMGVEGALYGIVDRPEFMHKLVARMTDDTLEVFDQAQKQGLLCGPQQPLVHCTGAYSDDLPAKGYDTANPRTQDMWCTGLAQMLATVSPAMFQEFEVDYVKRIFARCGLVYYGCCDPLDLKMDQVRMLPNVRKVSMSPWVNQDRGAAQIGRQYVYSRKPSPAHLAMDRFDADLVRQDLLATREACDRNGCPLEYILKDISTLRYQPQRLTEWANIAMEVAMA